MNHMHGSRQKTTALSVVLLDDVEGIGSKGEETGVAPGYMRNYLYPTGLATYATQPNVEKFKTVFEDEGNSARKAFKVQLKKFAKKLAATPVVLRRNTNDGIKCHPGDVTAANVAEKLLKQKGIVVDPKRISLVAPSYPGYSAEGGGAARGTGVAVGYSDDELNELSDEEVDVLLSAAEDAEAAVVAAAEGAAAAGPAVLEFPLNTLGEYRASYAFSAAAAYEAAGMVGGAGEDDHAIEFIINLKPR